MPDICAAIGIAQLREYSQQLLPERKRIAQRYADTLKQFHWAELPPLKSAVMESAYHIFPLCIKGITESMRDDMIDIITGMGVSVNVHFIPLPMLSLFKEKGYSIDAYPMSHTKFSREISLPIYPQLTNDQADYVLSAVILAYNNVISNRGL